VRRRNPQQLDLDMPLTAAGPTVLSRATARRSRHVEAPAPKPWLCTILAVDTAKRSGWAVYSVGCLCSSGEVDTLDEATLEQLVHNAASYTIGRQPLVLVLEAPYGGRVEVITALGVARERWLRAWRTCGQASSRIVRVQPSTWRGPVLGAEWVSAPRDQVRAHELLTARALVSQMPRSRPLRVGAELTLGHDEAAAILIGRWAAHAAAVGRAIGKTAAKASLRAWTGGRR
jgi:hypothetical protein